MIVRYFSTDDPNAPIVEVQTKDLRYLPLERKVVLDGVIEISVENLIDAIDNVVSIEKDKQE